MTAHPPSVPGASPAPAADQAPSATSDADLTLHLEPREAFEVVRTLLRDAPYDEVHVAQRLGLPTLIGITRLSEGRSSLAGEVDDATSTLIRLFIDGVSLPASVVRQFLGDQGISALQALGTLGPSADGDPELLEPKVAITPVEDLWFASDRLPMGSDASAARQDFVYSSSNELTRQFLSAIPDAAGKRVLELCAGTGVAAIRALRHGAASAVATDLTSRSVHFARFNARLNGVEERFLAVQSDVWSALADESFDLVVAHPPYVPALTHRFDFRDAGDDGEVVTRRIIEGLGARVARGGRVVIRAGLGDRRKEKILQRVRAWLGDASDEFDVIQLETMEYSPLDAFMSVTRGRTFSGLDVWMERFHRWEVDRFAVSVLEFRREAYGRSPISERRVSGGTVAPAVFDWHWHWGRFVSEAGATEEERMVGLHPRVAAGVRVAVHLESDPAGGWGTIGASVETNWPSHGMVKAPPLTPTLLELCDGTRDVAALHAALRSAGLVSDEVTPANVARLVEVLAAAGAVEVEACPLPPRPPGPGMAGAVA